MEEAVQKPGIMALVTNKSLQRNLLLMIALWVLMSVSGYVLSFYTKYMQGDVFINNIILGLTVLFGVWAAGIVT